MAEPSLWVDFARADEDDVVWSFKDRADEPEALEAGAYVRLYDWEGNQCLGIVTRVEDELVYVALELSTWRDASPSVEDIDDLVSALLTRTVRIPEVEIAPSTGATDVETSP